jgi:hypothetical protein
VTSAAASFSRKIAALARGEVPIFEPGLADLVKTNLREGRLKFATELAPAVRAADAVPARRHGPARLRLCRGRKDVSAAGFGLSGPPDAPGWSGRSGEAREFLTSGDVHHFAIGRGRGPGDTLRPNLAKRTQIQL